MSASKDLSRLGDITQLVLDSRLQALRHASAAREKSQMQLAALTASDAPTDLPAIAAGLVALNYQRWADLRRAGLNAVIARQTAEWMQAKAAASLAFGRTQALRGIVERLK
ncbi:hypothetical protein [Tabrizicola sp.]|uniref:hypothetical protein n=1 Tax=Tabrizicola sp. TaxID=2005166 RepID=UPI00286B1868|nr:hypothetical protein [Tabrizicola sp.]